jgi:hypothetical protein
VSLNSKNTQNTQPTLHSNNASLYVHQKSVCSFIKYKKHSNNTSLKQPFTQVTLRSTIHFTYIKKVSVHSFNIKTLKTTLHSNNSSLYVHQKRVCSFIKYKKHSNNSSLYRHQKSVLALRTSQVSLHSKNTKNTQTTLHSNNSLLYVHQKVSV